MHLKLRRKKPPRLPEGSANRHAPAAKLLTNKGLHKRDTLSTQPS